MKSTLGIFATISILLLSSNSIVLADQADLDKELNNYVSVINGSDFEAAKASMETLRWSGISDLTVYDPIAEKLDAIKNSKDEKKKAAWYAKALGFSGNEKYRPLLESILSGDSHKNVKKYATIGLKHLDNHKTWNAAISQGVATAPAGKLEETRIANMLRATDHELMRLGAKRVANAYKGNEPLIDIAADRLDKEWQSVYQEKGAQIDGVAWLLKAVGSSRSGKHKPLVEKILDGTTYKKVKKYAKKALKQMKD